jgi:hypothetical protein
MRIERARYEVDLARRQHDAVDPDNRPVARGLEGRLEEALRSLERTEAKLKHVWGSWRRRSNAERELLKRYAHDLAALWKAPATRPQDQKRIARCLLEAVVVTVPPEEGGDGQRRGALEGGRGNRCNEGSGGSDTGASYSFSKKAGARRQPLFPLRRPRPGR